MLSVGMNAGAKFVTYVPLVAIALVMIEMRHQPWDAMRWAGVILASVGFVLLTVARLELGNSFSVTPQARRLVTQGVYSKIRHPVYIFSALGLSGLILYLHLPVFLIVLVPLIAMQVWRARAEERVLHAKFGEEWERYRQQTWF